VIDFVDYIIKAVCAALGSTMAVVFRVSKNQRKNIIHRFVVGAVGGFFTPPIAQIVRPELAGVMGFAEQAMYFFAGASFVMGLEIAVLFVMRQRRVLGESEEAQNGDS